MKMVAYCLAACLMTTACSSNYQVDVRADPLPVDMLSEIETLVGTVTIRTAEDGIREIVLDARNATDHTLWVPSTDGSRGMIGCEAVNIADLADSLRMVHYDYAICRFPDQYIQLKPTETIRYVYELPNGLSERISISVWAPWRDSQGNLVSPETKREAVPENSILIEEVKR